MSKIYDYNQICDNVKQSDNEIRFAGVINERGRLVAGGIKEGIKFISTEQDDEMLFMELALRVKMRKEFNKQLGDVNFAMASRGSCMEMSVPISNDILYVISEPSSNYVKTLETIFKIINN